MPAKPDNRTKQPTSARSLAGRVAAVMVIIGSVVFWVWIFSGAPKRANPDRVDDRAFVERTHERCQALRRALDRLPDARQAESASERARDLGKANLLVTAMVDDIEADSPTQGDDRQRLRGWIGDWRTYVDDREAYAEALLKDPDARMTLSENPALSDGVDKTIEVFADVNDMPDCATPGDVG